MGKEWDACCGCERNEAKVKDLESRLAAFEATVGRLRDALDISTGAIKDAICLEDGLDGSTGEAVLKIISDAIASIPKTEGEIE